MKKIVVIGSLNMDLVIDSPRIPVLGETVLGNGFITNPGGKGANQAVAAAKLGSNVAMIGCVGKDNFGRELISNLEQNRIDISGIKITESASTGVAVIVISQGNNMIIVNPGANFNVTSEFIEGFEQSIADAALIVLQMEIPLDTIERVICIANIKKIPVLFNPAPAVQIPAELYKKVTYLTPNESECEILTGKTIKNIEDAKEVVTIFENLGVQQVIITLGRNGVVYNNQKGIVHIPAKKVEAVDTTGAGDAFSGALASGIVEQMDIDKSVEFAVCVSALAVTKYGAQAAMPTRKEVIDRFYYNI